MRTPVSLPARRRGEINIPGQDKVVQARFLDGKEPQWKGETATRPTLAEWITAAENPYFARAIVNRMWTHFFGVGLADRADGTIEDGPASHKELCDKLARELTAHHYDVKFLIRAITASESYQRTSAASHPSQKSTRLFARMALRGMSPEQLFDSLAVATEYGGDAAASGPGLFPVVRQSARASFSPNSPPRSRRPTTRPRFCRRCT